MALAVSLTMVVTWLICFVLICPGMRLLLSGKNLRLIALSLVPNYATKAVDWADVLESAAYGNGNHASHSDHNTQEQPSSDIFHPGDEYLSQYQGEDWIGRYDWGDHSHVRALQCEI